MPRPRKKAADDPSAHKRGPTPWCVGNKAAFIRRRFPTWLALNRKQRGLYLDATLVAFVLAFGMFFDIKTDLDYLPNEPEAGKTTINFDDYDDAQRERAEEYMKGLRTKISAFLREERDRMSDAAKNVDIHTLWNEHIQAQAAKRPAGTLRLTHYYSVYHYDERIKSAFEAEWEDVWKVWREKCASWEDEGVAIPKDEKEPHPVAVRTRVTQACWDREPQPFKELVQEAYEKYKAEKQASRGIPADIPDELRTPQDFQDALDAASVYLPPTADAIGGKTGWICSVLIAGPMPSEGGEIGMLSVHHGVTLDGQLKWYQADRVGYGKVERHFVGFAKLCFADTTCESRSLGDGSGTGTSLTAILGSTPQKTIAPVPPPSAPRSPSPPRQTLTRLRRGRRSPSPPSPRESSPEPERGRPARSRRTPRIPSAAPSQETSPTPFRAPTRELSSTRAPSPTHDSLRELSLPRMRSQERSTTRELSKTREPSTTRERSKTREPSTTREPLQMRELSMTRELPSTTRDLSTTRELPSTTREPLQMRELSTTRELSMTRTPSSKSPMRVPSREPSLMRMPSGEDSPMRVQGDSSPSRGPLPEFSSTRKPSPTRDSSCPPVSGSTQEPTSDSLGLRGSAPPSLETPPPSPMLPPTPHPTPYKETPPRFRLLLESLTRPLSQITNGLDETNGLQEEHPPAPEQARLTRRAALADDEDIESGQAHEVWSYRSTDRWSLHIRDVFEAVQRGRGWGLAFATAVHTFFTLEDYMDYPIRHDGRRILGGSIRPAAYNTWTRQGCPYDLSVDLGDLSVFAQKYWLWWEALQPAGRLDSDNGLITIEEFEGTVKGMDDWDGLEKCCGKDGVVQVLLLLLWWGDAVHGAGARPEQWLEWDTAVQDFRDILRILMATPGFEKVARKRARARPAADKADNENGGTGIVKSVKGSRKRKAGNVGGPKASKRAKATELAVDNTSTGNTKGPRKRKADTPAVADKPTKRAKGVKSTPALTSTLTPATSASTPATMAPSTTTAVEGEGRTLRNRETLVKSFKVRQSAA